MNKLRNDYNRGRRTFIIDATPGDLNINFKGKKVSKESWVEKNYAWVGEIQLVFTLATNITLVLDYKTKMPVYFMIDRGSPNDTTMVSKILPILQRKRIIRKKDIILMNRGYYSYKNYKLALQKISCDSINFNKIQIQQRKAHQYVKLSITFISCKIQFKYYKKKAYKKLVKELLEKIDKRDKIKFHRGYIEDYFKLLKKGL